MARNGFAFAIVLSLVVPAWPVATEPDLGAATARVRRLLEELVTANPENPPGSEARVVAIGAARLRAAGIPFQVFEFAPGRSNLVARLKGDGSAPPLLLLAHIDVVPTAGQPWTVPPHQVTEKGDRIYGRGVLDDLSMAAVEMEIMLRLHESKTALRRDVILAWTGGEETGGDGIRWQLENHPEVLADAGLAFNEGGILELGTGGTVTRATLVVAEKTTQDFTFRAKGTAGHSSAPWPDNAINSLARALDRLARNPFPPRLLAATRAYFGAAAATEEPKLAEAMRAVAAAPGSLPEGALEVIAAKPRMAALLRTTCVATQISGGTARNVLPAEATANVNCRILPDQSVEEVRRSLLEIVADPGVEIVAAGTTVEGRAVPVEGEGPSAFRQVVERLHPGATFVPMLVNYFTDSRSLTALGISAYGIGIFPVAEQDTSTMHGTDERIPTASLRSGIALLDGLVYRLAVKR